MNRAIDAGVHVVGRDQAGEETHAIGPAALIDKIGPYELTALFVRAARQAGYDDGEEASQRHNDC